MDLEGGTKAAPSFSSPALFIHRLVASRLLCYEGQLLCITGSQTDLEYHIPFRRSTAPALELYLLRTNRKHLQLHPRLLHGSPRPSPFQQFPRGDTDHFRKYRSGLQFHNSLGLVDLIEDFISNVSPYFCSKMVRVLVLGIGTCLVFIPRIRYRV